MTLPRMVKKGLQFSLKCRQILKRKLAAKSAGCEGGGGVSRS